MNALVVSLKARCRKWLFADPNRCIRVLRLYNGIFHRLRPSLFDGRHPHFPRTSRNSPLKQYHQDPVWRTMNGDNVLSHMPGEGKSEVMMTYTPTPIVPMETVTVRKNDLTITIALAETSPGHWQVYRFAGQHHVNWSVTVGRWFASRLDALQFVRDRGYVIDNAHQFDAGPKVDCRPHNADTPVAAHAYRFRAECERDVDELRRLLGITLERITLTNSPPFPDVEVEIELPLSLEALREVMRRVVDGHVMVQTVARRDDYTGERDYEL